jgi:hypothetical protein
MPRRGRPATAQAMGKAAWTARRARDRSVSNLWCAWFVVPVVLKYPQPSDRPCRMCSPRPAQDVRRSHRSPDAVGMPALERDARVRAARSRWTDPSRMKARRCAEVLAPDQEHPCCASEKTPGEVSRRVHIGSVGNRPAWVRGAPSAAQCDVARDRHLLRDQGRPTSGDNVPWRQPAVKKIAWKGGARAPGYGVPGGVVGLAGAGGFSSSRKANRSAIS